MSERIYIEAGDSNLAGDNLDLVWNGNELSLAPLGDDTKLRYYVEEEDQWVDVTIEYEEGSANFKLYYEN